MVRKASKVQGALLAKGFKMHEGTNHRRFFFYTSKGTKSGVNTSISRGSKKDIGKSLLSDMATECKLTNREFEQLVDCPMSREAYERLLGDRGHL